MIKKIIILLAVLFLLTGCSGDYNLYITDDEIKEQVIFNGVSSMIQPYSVFYDVDGFSESGTKLEDVEYYNMVIKDNNLVLSYDFDWENYTRSNAVRTCLKSHSLKYRSDNTYLLNTSKGISCFSQLNMEKLNINITLDNNYYKLISTNADITNGNTYTWVVDESNYQNKYIQIIFENKEYNSNEHTGYNDYTDYNNNKKDNQENEDKKLSNDYFWMIFGSATVLLIVVIIIVVKVKSYKR